MSTPKVIVFDVNETLSDMGPMNQRFADIGAPELLSRVWFASLLRDGFALSTVGSSEKFATIGSEILRTLLPDFPINCSINDAIDRIMSGFLELDVHRDVPTGIKALTSSGYRLISLTNGSVNIPDRLFTNAGIRENFEQLLSVDDAGIWKPANTSYLYAANKCGVELSEMLLVAVHPWDIDGAARAGLRTAWINRLGKPYPSYFNTPDYSITALPQLVETLNH